ncbi:MAG: EamA family transporter [Bacteroidaceae bacterium]|nr:EamA family transporter [Bacteroidaceae bacterium]
MYTQPLVSLVCSVVVLGEPITPIVLLGTVFILVGIYVVERGFSQKNQKTSRINNDNA